jgi:hypothetical protein
LSVPAAFGQVGEDLVFLVAVGRVFSRPSEGAEPQAYAADDAFGGVVVEAGESGGVRVEIRRAGWSLREPSRLPTGRRYGFTAPFATSLDGDRNLRVDKRHSECHFL